MHKKEKAARKPLDIKWTIFSFLIGFCLLLLIILWLFQTVFLQSFYTSIKLAQVSREAATLAELYETGDEEAFAANIYARGDFFVELIDEAGETQVVSGMPLEAGIYQWPATEKAALYARTVENGGTLSLRYRDDMAPPSAGDIPPPGDGPGQSHEPSRKGAENILHAQIVQNTDGEEYLLLVRAVITPVNATTETLRTQLWIISIIMLVLATGIALLIAKRVAKPIENLNTSAARLGRGHYDVRFEEKGFLEVAELSQTLSHAATELEKTESLQRDLIANVSHDLRTPLTLITGYAEMIRDIPGENTPENMQVIIDEAKRLSSLVVDLLDLSQLQAGTSHLQIEPVNLTDIVESIIERFSKFSEPAGYTVLCENTAKDACVNADSKRIAQVIYNFLINAMNHSGDDKTITVRQHSQNGRVKVEVTDHGEGIDAANLPYIWDRYYKVNEVHTRALAGTGLGLSIVKSILQQHPGIEYGADSKIGQGSTFWFSLPISD